ncbi:MAG TPA: O-antigen ligase family protein [Longimicrobium sp.]|jgi:O-antigen ligase|uniref:O-antigen ligase family protein n=1 Tax=Longimicrobium sp. TaxID=2029185 RepID=UPI002ED7D887
MSTLAIDIPFKAASPQASGTSAARQYAQDFLCFGAVAAVLAYMPGEMLFSDNHAFPAELVLHAFALGALLACAVFVRRLRVDAVDAALIAFAALGALSALGAANPWFAVRSLGLTVSGVGVFLAARALAREAIGPQLTAFAAVAVVAAAAAALLEAYGVLGRMSEVNRAPGGTMGSRSQMAHLLAIGLPVLLAQAVRARRRLDFALYAGAVAVVAAALVLSRSRSAWLAALLAVVLGVAAYTLSARRAPGGLGVPPRAVLLPVAFAAGVAGAVLLPNQLEWRSQTPYADSVRGLANFEVGSGRGRIIQYGNTLRMVGDHALLGVGPGNWAVAYPRYASAKDPSYEPRYVLPTTRLPQSEWLGTAAERGLPALLLLVLAAAVLARRGWRRLRDPDAERALQGLVLLCTLTSLLVVGTLDPVLMTPTAAFLAFVLLGALASDSGRTWEVPLNGRRRALLAAGVVCVAAVPVAFSARQLAAGYLYANVPDVETWQRALRMNPGDYRAHALFSNQLIRTGRCADALPYIARAGEMFPTAPAVAEMRRHCLRIQAEAARTASMP